MLIIEIPGGEFWDDNKEEFIYSSPTTLRLEHSLVAVSKWESKWHKPFFSSNKKEEKTTEEILDYIRCMSLDDVSLDVLKNLKKEQFEKISDYINDPHTATTINDKNRRPGKRTVITAEVIYYQMISFGIPFECQHWHINNLFMLIRVCESYNKPPKKMSQRDILSQNAALNAARRRAMGSSG